MHHVFSGHQLTNQYFKFFILLILTSFILAWAEAWFFDFCILPQETQARNWIWSKQSFFFSFF